MASPSSSSSFLSLCRSPTVGLELISLALSAGWRASHHPKDDNELILTGRRSLVIEYSIYIAREHLFSSSSHLFVLCIYIINGIALSALSFSVPNSVDKSVGLELCPWISSHLMDLLVKSRSRHSQTQSWFQRLLTAAFALIESLQVFDFHSSPLQ